LDLLGTIFVAKHAHIVDLEEMARLKPVPRTVLWWASANLVRLMQGVWGRVRVEMENYPALTEPVLFAVNHTHYFDFLPSRVAIWAQQGLKTVTFVKYRAFQNRLEGAYMKRLGNIPLGSRGYLLSADFARVHGRKPELAEYRELRAHLDEGERLSDGPLQALLTQPRDMLGLDFDPEQSSYREMMEGCYSKAMSNTLAHAQTVLDAGLSLHIYPQGLYSTRLSQGRIGAVQIAAKLGIPIVPVGFSGMNKLFAPMGIIPKKKGVLHMRFGDPYRIERQELHDFQAFEPREEQRLRPVLEQETALLMDKINDLLDPECARGEDLVGDGIQGVGRFFE